MAEEKGSTYHWVKVREPEVFRTWHIIPMDDIFGHEWDECPCGPKTLPAKSVDGGVGWIEQHYALDGRSLPDGSPGAPVPTSEEGGS